MIDAAQTILIGVIAVLAILLVGLGIQVFFILKELRKTIEKTNKVLDDTGVITESVSEPISSLASLGTTIKAATSVVSLFMRKAERSPKRSKGEKENGERE